MYPPLRSCFPHKEYDPEGIPVSTRSNSRFSSAIDNNIANILRLPPHAITLPSGLSGIENASGRDILDASCTN